jgi:hypothetical protein
MTAPKFLAWAKAQERRWELLDAIVRKIAPGDLDKRRP